MNFLKGFLQKLLSQRSFTIAAIIYFFNSLGNVGQGVFIKYYNAKLNIGLYEFMTLRCLVEIIVLLPFCLKYLRHFTKNLHIVAFVAFLYAGDMLLFHRGLKTVTVNTGSLILLLVPLWIIVLGRVILKEKKFNLVNAVFLFICLLGVFFTIFQEVSFSGFNTGYLYLLADAFVIPFGLIMQKKYSDCRPVVYAIFTNSIALSILGFGMSGFQAPEMSFENVKGAFVVACFDMLEVACVYIAFQMTEPALLQPIRFTRIFVSMILSFVVLHESVASYQLIGSCIIIFANVGSVIYSRKKQEK